MEHLRNIVFLLDRQEIFQHRLFISIPSTYITNYRLVRTLQLNILFATTIWGSFHGTPSRWLGCRTIGKTAFVAAGAGAECGRTCRVMDLNELVLQTLQEKEVRDE